jgi:hypothetical protein
MRPRGRLVVLCTDSHIEARRIAWILAQRLPVDADVNPARVRELPLHMVRVLVVFSGLKHEPVNKELLEWLLAPWAELLPFVPVLYLAPDPGRPPIVCSDVHKLADMVGLIGKIKTLGVRKRGPKRDCGRIRSGDLIDLNQQSNLA